MALEGIREQFKDKWADISSSIQESSWFNNLREKFEEQSRTAQRAIVFGSAALVVFMLLLFPWGYISDSQDHMSGFAENQSLIQGLLRAARTTKEASPLPAPVPVDTLKSRVTQILSENRLIPDQIGEIQPLPDKPVKDLVPAVVVQIGLAVQLKKLNLDQIVNLSHALHSMGNGAKLMGLDIMQSAGQTNYYDMVAKVVAFTLPPTTEAEPPPEKGSKKTGKSARKKPQAEENPE